MKRRDILQSLAAAGAASTLSLSGCASGRAAAKSQSSKSPSRADLDQALERFKAQPGVDASCLVDIALPGAPLQAVHQPDQYLFIGSATKTFILAEFLRGVEAGRLKEDALVTIDDSVRTPSSPVLGAMSGQQPAKAALEAMISHSDNIATDIALAAATPARVRELIAQAGLTHTQIPDSTRRLFSWLAGAAPGVDLGWAGMQRMDKDNWMPGPARHALNDEQTMASTANEMVHWYAQALAGKFFAKPETLVEFKRIQAMADAVALVVPADTAAYAKGGSINWEQFHCFCVAGQMIVRRVPVTFCFTINWSGADDTVPATFARYRDATASVLQAASDMVWVAA